MVTVPTGLPLQIEATHSSFSLTCQVETHGVFVALANTDLKTKPNTRCALWEGLSWNTGHLTLHSLTMFALNTNKCHLLFVSIIWMVSLVFFKLAKKKHLKPIKHSLKLRQTKLKVSEHNREDNEVVISRSRLQCQQGPTTKQEAVTDAMARHTPPTVLGTYSPSRKATGWGDSSWGQSAWLAGLVTWVPSPEPK